MARPRAPLLLVAFWLVPATVATLGFRLVPSRLNPDLSVLELFASQLGMWLPWAAWSLVILAAGRRFPFARGRMTRAVLAHAALWVVVVPAQILVVAAVGVAFGIAEPRGLESTVVIGLRVYGDIFTVIFWAIVVTHAGFRWHAALQAQTLLSARLGQDLVEAQLRALQSQLNPHFLFNALNSVVTLIGRDAPEAQRMVVRLADLLRATLRAGEAQRVTLAQEMDLTRRYLEIEQVRFADRLRVAWDVPDELGAVMVPAFALQPLVENAIVHGVARRPQAGRVAIRAARSGGRLVISVRDDGPGPAAPPARADGGVGLANLRSRLERMYGAGARLELRAAPEGGAEAVLGVPIED